MILALLLALFVQDANPVITEPAKPSGSIWLLSHVPKGETLACSVNGQPVVIGKAPGNMRWEGNNSIRFMSPVDPSASVVCQYERDPNGKM